MSVGGAQGAKRRGILAERAVVAFLKERGYEAFRTAGSFGRADIICRTRGVFAKRTEPPLALESTIGIELKATIRRPRPSDFFKRSKLFYHIACYGLWWPPGSRLEDAQLFQDEYWPEPIATLGEAFPEVFCE